MSHFLPEIGLRLDAERRRLKLTLADFAEAGGISARTINAYVAGDRPPDVLAMSAWAEAGVDVLYVITGRNDIGALSAADQDVLAELQSMDEGRRAALLEFLRAFNARPSKIESRRTESRSGQVDAPSTGGVLIKGGVGQVVSGGQVDQTNATFTVGAQSRKSST